jgi:hypothetical protein
MDKLAGILDRILDRSLERILDGSCSNSGRRAKPPLVPDAPVAEPTWPAANAMYDF